MESEYHYIWEGMGIDGQLQKGESTGANKQEIIKSCQKNGIVIIKIHKKRASSFYSPSFSRLKTNEINFFVIQLKTMLESGLPLLDCLAMLVEVSESRVLREVITHLILTMKSGETFSQSLSHYPQYFSSLFISLIEVGEQTGNLSQTLDQLLTYQQIESLLSQKVKKAMMYPCVVFFSTLLIASGLLIFIVPRFISIFTSMHATLPSLTQYLVNLSLWFSLYWDMITMVILGLWGTVKLTKKYSHSCRILSARMLLMVPIVGPIVHKAVIIRYCKTLTTLLLSGITINQACQRAAIITDNDYFIYMLNDVPQGLASGYSFSQILKDIGPIPDLMYQMIRVGEESGELASMLEHISHHYLTILSANVEQLGQLLEPVFLFILGGLVGILVIALYLPIFDLMTVMR